MKKIILIIFLILSIGIGIIVINNQMNTSKNILASESKNALKANNAITMMYETDIGSGEYQTTTDTTWPQDGYIFNERLSACENGSTLTWDNENKTVKMKASISDKCYLYFDKYDIPIINTVTASDTNYNSVTLTVNATSSTSTIAKYYYSKDDGNSYTESTNNTYTFSGLTANTTYDFKVYVEDANGITSKEYAISIDTSAYINPTISRVTTANIKYNSVTLNVTASAGTNNITRYYYSSNNGSTWVNSTSASYTFNNLTASTRYNFKVYAVDSEGHQSNQYSVSATTSAYVNPSISRVTTSNISATSITLNVTATAGSNSISRYYYSSNNGSTWVNSTSSRYTFNNLTAGRSYTFKVYVVDSANHKSSQYTITERPRISFKIDGITYYGNPYSSYETWESWVDSQYNTSPDGLWNNGVYIVASLNEGKVVFDEYGPVDPSSAIIDGGDYYLIYYGA